MADKNNGNSNPFTGCTIAATGKLENFTRDGINSKIASLGAIATSSVTCKTDYLICGKLVKARELGKTANFIFDNGVHLLGSAEPTMKENSLFYDGEFFKVGEGKTALTEDKFSDDNARMRTMTGMAMELRNAGLHKAECIADARRYCKQQAMNTEEKENE